MRQQFNVLVAAFFVVLAGLVSAQKPAVGAPKSAVVAPKSAVVAPKSAYDIGLQYERVLIAGEWNNFRATLTNVGAPIVGPAKITINVAYPAGVKITGGQGGGVSGAMWTLIPGYPTAGPTPQTLTYTITSGTTVPTGAEIGSLTIFGTATGNSHCATATQLSVSNVVVVETNTANNTACAR